MNENGINDLSRVGLYGLTYKENVDDTRESPTLQLLDVIRETGKPMPQVYDPFISRGMVPNQHHALDAFLEACDLVVIMVGHSELRDNLGVLDGKIVFDTRNIMPERERRYTL